MMNGDDDRIRENFVVYLSGAMIEDHPDHRTWRREAIKRFNELGIATRSPYRGRDKSKIMKVDKYHYTVSTAPISNRLGNMLVARDLKDVEDCDVLLMNLTGTKDERPAIGTLSELAWAYQLRKPVICVVDEETTNSHYYKHPFMHQFISQWVGTVDEAISVIANYWHPQAVEGD